MLAEHNEIALPSFCHVAQSIHGAPFDAIVEGLPGNSFTLLPFGLMLTKHKVGPFCHVAQGLQAYHSMP